VLCPGVAVGDLKVTEMTIMGSMLLPVSQGVALAFPNLRVVLKASSV